MSSLSPKRDWGPKRVKLCGCSAAAAAAAASCVSYSCGVGVAPEWEYYSSRSRYQYAKMVAEARHFFFLFFSICFPLFLVSFDFSLSHRMCMSGVSYPVRWHGIALPTYILALCSFATTELVSRGFKNQRIERAVQCEEDTLLLYQVVHMSLQYKNT